MMIISFVIVDFGDVGDGDGDVDNVDIINNLDDLLIKDVVKDIVTK